MHYDRDGKPLQMGDIVLVPCVVYELLDIDTPLNVALYTVEPVPIPEQGANHRDKRRTTNIALNTRQVVKGSI